MTVNPYLNFNGNAEEAFNFSKSVIGGEFSIFQRFGDIPEIPDMPPIPKDEKNKIMHVSLPIGKGNVLMASDVSESFGHSEVSGNNISLSLGFESNEEADRLFAGLSDGGVVTMGMADMFWGAYFGMFTDRFGIKWMISCESRE